MAYTKIYEGVTFPPGTTHPPNVYFKNCTFLATNTLGEGSLIDGCKFQKCCPTKYQNAPSRVVKSRVINSTLESVTLDKDTFGHNNTNTGYKVTDNSWTREGITHGEGIKVEVCNTPCTGISISPNDNAYIDQCYDNTCNPRGIINEEKGG